ncbi:hypothetical protein GIY23_21185 [Allosaccharopolyspora coralli]|uniref:Uncharacterized protein n=1 Tax=Allosaccharopolyspora coralli TaxID=2665642 RepID=A0A5Q3QAW1_9PSEU|nr:hypothetical protein [Allosaccharopolyspora coralli]QGK71698.1 hypothetical protein GIY23_21185 [Allosaccharopolyspora coralli]
MTVFGFCAWRGFRTLRALLLRAAFVAGLTAVTLFGVQVAAPAAPDVSDRTQQTQEQLAVPADSSPSDHGQSEPPLLEANAPAHYAPWASHSTPATSVTYTETAQRVLGALPVHLTAPTAGPAHTGFTDAQVLAGTVATEPSVSPD